MTSWLLSSPGREGTSQNFGFKSSSPDHQRLPGVTCHLPASSPVPVTHARRSTAQMLRTNTWAFSPKPRSGLAAEEGIFLFRTSSLSRKSPRSASHLYPPSGKPPWPSWPRLVPAGRWAGWQERQKCAMTLDVSQCHQMLPCYALFLNPRSVEPTGFLPRSEIQILSLFCFSNPHGLTPD